MTKKPRKSGDSRPKDHKDDNDSVLWRRVASTVTPLKKRSRVAPKPTPVLSGDSAENREKPSPKTRPSPRRPQPSSRPPRPEPVSQLVAGRAEGIDRRTLNRLRRGQIPIDARLDLHGYTRAQAQDALISFISDASEHGKRCLLVVTGRGMRTQSGIGVIKEALPGWLNDPLLRPKILAFCEARPEHGGAGAHYVLLRRSRKSG